MIPLCSPKQARLPTSIALGSFDGLHSGHRRVINEITKNAQGVPTVVSFWPHPREILYQESRLRLDLPSEKTFLLGPLRIEQLVLIPFDHSLSKLRAEEFVNKILIKKLQARKIAVGENFRFGHNREGDAFCLKEIAISSGVEVVILPIVEDINGRMSSSRIRCSLSKGNIEEATKLMGRPYRFKGRVVKGKGIGKGLGWPTANLNVDGRKFLPALGVYAAWTKIKNRKNAIASIMNLGPQPTIDPASPSAVEVHLLDQDLDLVGQELIVEPVKRLREQKKFDNFKQLSNQIALDAKQAIDILKNV